MHMSCTSLVMTKEKLKETLSLRVTEQLYKELERAAAAERRDLSDAARALLERGVAAYKQDRKLFEPEGIPGSVEAHPGDTISVPTLNLGKKGAKRKQRA
jgi:hypothetical protein